MEHILIGFIVFLAAGAIVFHATVYCYGKCLEAKEKQFGDWE